MSDELRSAFERVEEESRRTLLGECVEFLKHNKKFYLIPIVIVLLLMGLLVALGSTAAAPFIYTLF